METFLSHAETKHELTECLEKHLTSKLSAIEKPFVVVYHSILISHIFDYNDDLEKLVHKEAGILIILYALHETASDSYSDLYTVSQDTDVLLLLIYLYTGICISISILSRVVT